MKLILACILVMLGAASARAEYVPPPEPTDYSQTVGTGAANLTLPLPNRVRLMILLVLPDAGDVSCRTDGVVAVLHAAGTIPLLNAGAVFARESSITATAWVPQGNISCIAAAAATKLTVKVIQ